AGGVLRTAALFVFVALAQDTVYDLLGEAPAGQEPGLAGVVVAVCGLGAVAPGPDGLGSFVLGGFEAGAGFGDHGVVHAVLAQFLDNAGGAAQRRAAVDQACGKALVALPAFALERV